MEHVQHKCNKEDCYLCTNELFQCEVCGGAEGELPKECPGKAMSYSEKRLVLDGSLDFENGMWSLTEKASKGIKYTNRLSIEKPYPCRECGEKGFWGFFVDKRESPALIAHYCSMCSAKLELISLKQEMDETEKRDEHHRNLLKNHTPSGGK